MRYYRKLVGERLYLSPVRADDGDEDKYLQWMNDRAVAENFNEYHRVVASRADLGWIYAPGEGMQRYAIVLLDGDELIGSISIHSIDHRNRNAFIGVFIGDAERRNKGYGAEAIRLLLAYGFRTLNLHNILLSVHADNAAAIACYRKVGFREVGRLPEWIFKDGRYVDKVYMGVLDREFL